MARRVAVCVAHAVQVRCAQVLAHPGWLLVGGSVSPNRSLPAIACPWKQGFGAGRVLQHQWLGKVDGHVAPHEVGWDARGGLALAWRACAAGVGPSQPRKVLPRIAATLQVRAVAELHVAQPIEHVLKTISTVPIVTNMYHHTCLLPPHATPCILQTCLRCAILRYAASAGDSSPRDSA